MSPAPSSPLAVYKGKAFVRFAKKARITDADLWKAAQLANDGLIDADPLFNVHEPGGDNA